MKNNTKLSIITINYNNRDGLKKTIESVVGQTFRDFEYVIIDGGSNDGSVEVIKEYADRIDYWVSERDKGIYNAMNKGAFAAHGEYTLFLNSGDAFINEDVLNNVFKKDLSADIVCGNILNDKGGAMIAPQKVTMEYFLFNSLPHPSTFIKRYLFDSHSYDERFRIVGDWEFFLHHIIVRNSTYQQIDEIVTIFDTTGISSQQLHFDDLLAEEVLNSILLPRVREDYMIYTGQKDDIHRLFYLILHSKLKTIIYSINVILIKILLLNKGWIKKFRIGLH